MNPHSKTDNDAEVSRCAAQNPLPIDSRDLLRGKTELRIRHNGEEYRLRLTRQNKLILTK